MRGTGRWARRCASGASLAVVLLWSAEAHLTQVHYQDVGLEEVVKGAGAVVVARWLEPKTAEEKIPIVPEGQKPDDAKYPPYRRIKYRFEVVELFRAPASATTLKVKQTIEVDQANFSQQLNLHRRYYLENVGRSPLYSRYTPSADVWKADKVILFLSLHKTGPALVYDEAWEVVAKKSDVKKLVEKTKDESAAVPVDD
jgi:hypothetical protein